MARAITRMLAVALGLWAGAAAGCQERGGGDPTPPSVGTNSNWLRACSPQDACREPPLCECGACTVACSSDADCSALADARCALTEDPAAWAECGSDSPGFASGICLPRCAPGGCDPGQACVAEACVLAPLPEAALCDAVASRPIEDRTHEEELLALLSEMRSAGIACGGGTPAPPVPVPRYDPRLVCAARVLAADIEQTRARSLTDSAGRSTEQRMQAAGYNAVFWSESFALDATSSARALEIMLGDAGSCQRFADARYREIGVGSSGDVHVISLGAQ
jgi:hypothetical protein